MIATSDFPTVSHLLCILEAVGKVANYNHMTAGCFDSQKPRAVAKNAVPITL